jgi:hypothetical protein
MIYHTLIRIDPSDLSTTIYYTTHKELVEVLDEISEAEYAESCYLRQEEDIKADDFTGRMLEDHFLFLASFWEDSASYGFLINTYKECLGI